MKNLILATDSELLVVLLSLSAEYWMVLMIRMLFQPPEALSESHK